MKGVPIHHVEYKRFLTEYESSVYLGMTKLEFRRSCPVDPHMRSQGKRVWDVNQLDQWQDGIAPVKGLIDEAISRL